MKKDDEGEEQDNPELFKTEIDYHRYWKDMYEKEHKLRLEAEGETHLVKAVGMNSPEMKAAKANIKELQDSLDRFKKENNDCYNRIAEALEVNESHQKLNGKLQERLTELEEENKKMHDHLNKRIYGGGK
jgi:Spy/CpxP family protein refolding chaperone|tara:strand:+ start:35 stop:424 length:390 start_codon:yes stop_codon:yes gene_type:complete